jgi:hypothetical protein
MTRGSSLVAIAAVAPGTSDALVPGADAAFFSTFGGQVVIAPDIAPDIDSDRVVGDAGVRANVADRFVQIGSQRTPSISDPFLVNGNRNGNNNDGDNDNGNLNGNDNVGGGFNGNGRLSLTPLATCAINYVHRAAWAT